MGLCRPLPRRIISSLYVISIAQFWRGLYSRFEVTLKHLWRFGLEPKERVEKVLSNIRMSVDLQLDDMNARKELGWSIRYGLKETVEDFIKESSV
jgi:nucleoside-diphosphate-sugar epimerase